MRNPPLILVYEWLTGSGAGLDSSPPELIREALAMLAAVLADFRAWGAARTVTLLDARLEEAVPGFRAQDLPADTVIRVGTGDAPRAFEEQLAACEAALVIAPETGGCLARLAHQVEQAGKLLLGSSSQASAAAGDKWTAYQLLRRAGVLTPATWRCSPPDAVQAAARAGFPLVIKPLDGVGCDGVALVQNREDLAAALKQIGRGCAQPGDLPEILLQKYIPGEHASVSLLAAAGGVLPLSLNQQQISSGIPFHYQGGTVPWEHPAKAQALAAAQAAVACVPGLRGYVGVDLVLDGGQAYVIEINPRLTTSYVGLRQVAAANLAGAIWKACRLGELPERVALCGQVTFHKGELPATKEN